MTQLIYKKIRVGGLIFDKQNEKMLFFHRWNKTNKDTEYFCAIGGTLEPNEEIMTALKREIFEEVNLKFQGAKKLFEYDHDEFVGHHEIFFLITKFSGEIKLGFPELGHLSPDNVFRPEWIRLSEIPSLNLLPPILKTWLRDNLDMIK